jgi:uncharacterized protein involved in type VI secretion and phage assembly
MSTINGVVIGLVTDVNDPLKQGRIRVNFPWLEDEHQTDWIRIATTMAGNGRGTFFMPELQDEALVAFEHGNVRMPYVIGFLWNGKDSPPGQDVRDRRITSKNGHSLRFLDATLSNGSKGAIVIEDAHGNRITMSNGKITIDSVGVLELKARTVTLNGRVLVPSGNPV